MTDRESAQPFQPDANRDSARPEMLDVDGVACPVAPQELAATGLDEARLSELLLKVAHTVPSFTTEWITQQLCLPMPLVEDLCWKLKDDQLVEILGQSGPLTYRYAVTNRGRELAGNLMKISGYLGPAPVSLAAYSDFITWQRRKMPPVTASAVEQAISSLVLPDAARDVAALAVSSGRSLFLFGPPGNGKTSLGRSLHESLAGHLWIPHCISIEANIIRVFDEHLHQRDEPDEFRVTAYDRRWVRIRRPFIVVGGEMTIEDLDLAYSPSLRYYEAPPHVKANGGTFLIDDLGRQRVAAEDLLNRWIIPLEHEFDLLTLNTGQRLQMPFELMLIVATNLTVSEVADPAFLRRMGYRLHINTPTPSDYRKIFQRYADGAEAVLPEGIVDSVIARYEAESRELRASEPRDLIERARDACRLRGQPLQLTAEIMDLAWTGYFGTM